MICQTLVGAEGSGATGRLRDGILLAGGATFRARNVVVTGFAGAALEARGGVAGRGRQQPGQGDPARQRGGRRTAQGRHRAARAARGGRPAALRCPLRPESGPEAAHWVAGSSAAGTGRPGSRQRGVHRSIRRGELDGGVDDFRARPGFFHASSGRRGQSAVSHVRASVSILPGAEVRLAEGKHEIALTATAWDVQTTRA